MLRTTSVHPVLILRDIAGFFEGNRLKINPVALPGLPINSTPMGNT